MKCGGLLSRFAGVLSLVLLLVLQGCRVETVRSLSAEEGAARDLFFSRDDRTSSGRLAGPFSFAAVSESLEPPEPTSLAGFGGGARRLLPPNLSGMDGFFTYCLPYQDVDLAPRVKIMLWKGRDAKGKDAFFSIVGLDVVGVPGDVTRKIVSTLAAGWPRLGLDHGNVQVVASHSHASIAGLTENPFWGVFACDRYSKRLWEFFESRLREAFARAVAGLEPVTRVSARELDLPGYNISRFKGMDVHRRLLTYSISGSEAPPESRVGDPCLSVFAVHPTWFGQGERTLSSDVVGHLEKELKALNHGKECFFLNGAVGNADIEGAKGNLDDYAQRFAEISFEVKAGVWKDVETDLEFSARVIDLPETKLNLRACKIPPIDAFVSARILDNLPPRTKISYAKLGRTLFVFFPGEAVFTVQRGIEEAVKAARPDVDVVQVLSVANDYLGYVVDSDSFDETTLESCSTLYGRRISETIRDSVVDLVKAGRAK